MNYLERLLGKVRSLGSGLYQVAPDGSKAELKVADLPCVYCEKPLRFARLRVQGGRAWPSIPKAGLAHLGCTLAFEAEVSRAFDAPSVAEGYGYAKRSEYARGGYAGPDIPAEPDNCAACGHSRKFHGAAETTLSGECYADGCICEKFHEQMDLQTAHPSDCGCPECEPDQGDDSLADATEGWHAESGYGRVSDF